jgi:hypothetical protein
MKKKYQQNTNTHAHIHQCSLFLQLGHGKNYALAVADQLTNHTVVQIASLFLVPVCRHQMTILPVLYIIRDHGLPFVSGVLLS